jgi:hypothetical protein
VPARDDPQSLTHPQRLEVVHPFPLPVAVGEQFDFYLGAGLLGHHFGPGRGHLGEHGLDAIQIVVEAGEDSRLPQRRRATLRLEDRLVMRVLEGDGGGAFGQ